MVEGILGKTVEAMLSKFIAKIAINMISSICDTNDIAQLENEITSFAKQKFESNFKHLDLSQEIDFEGLLDYISNDLMSDIVNYSRTLPPEEEIRCLDTILSKAHYHTHADTKPKKSVVDDFIKVSLGIVKEYYVGKVSTKDIVIGKAMAERTADLINPNIAVLSDNVNRQHQATMESNKEIQEDLVRIEKLIRDSQKGIALEELQLDKKLFIGLIECRKLIFDVTATLISSVVKTEESSILDVLLCPLLRTLLGDGTFPGFNLDEYTGCLDDVHKNVDILDVVKCRWSAIQLLYAGKRTEAIATLNATYSVYGNKETVPQWIKASILIDIRNLHSFSKEYNERRGVQNKISAGSENVHFPTLDRFERSTYSGLVDWYINDASKSIYSNELRNGTGMYEASEAILSSFITAAYYGSITHLWEVNLMLKKTLFFINCKYKDSKCFASYLKSCLISWENADKHSLENIFIEHFYLLSQEEIKAVFNSLCALPLLDRRLSSKLTAMRYMGSYMDDGFFEEALADCLQLIGNYSANNKSLFLMETDIVDFVKYSIRRIPIDVSVRLILEELNSSPEHISRITISALNNADFSEVNDKSYFLLTNFIADTVGCWNKNVEYLSVAIRMSLNKNRHKDFDELIKRIAPLFYAGKYSFNIAPNSSPSDALLNDYVERISALSKSKEKTGLISSSDFADFAELFNALAIIKTPLDSEMLSNMASELEKSILASSYDFDTKVISIEILSLLHMKFKSEAAESVAKIIFKKKGDIPQASRFFSSAPLDAFVDFLGVITNQIPAIDYAFALLDVKKLRVAEQVKFYEMLSSVAIHWDISWNQNETFAILVRFILDGIASDVHDIRHYSIRTLLGLAQANITSALKGRTLTLLHEIYDFDSPANKTFIIDGMSKIDSRSPLTIDVLEKARTDINYHVRACNQ